MLGTVVKTIQFATLNEVAEDCTTLQASADGMQSGLSTADVTDNEDVLSGKNNLNDKNNYNF